MSQAPARERSERDPHLDAAGLKAEAQRRQADVVARYRAAHAGATGSDKTIALVAALEAEFAPIGGCMTPEFVEFEKIARLSRPCVITEKIDGTNGVVYVGEDGTVLAGSRSRWITPEQDNHGFAAWVRDHGAELRDGLGVGTHYGEWWGAGVNKRYPGMLPKKFSLFNVSRWRDKRPECCDVVPILYEGLFDTRVVDEALESLARYGSRAHPGNMRPEGVVIFHVQGRLLFKKTLEKDEEPKSFAQRAATTTAEPAAGARP